MAPPRVAAAAEIHLSDLYDVVAVHFPRSSGRLPLAQSRCDEFGKRVKHGEELSFYTSKPFRAESLKGQRFWAFEGSGSPRRSWLVSSGIMACRECGSNVSTEARDWPKCGPPSPTAPPVPDPSGAQGIGLPP
jgi:hypothetical protein